MPHFEICNHSGHSTWPEAGTFWAEAKFDPTNPPLLASTERRMRSRQTNCSAQALAAFR
jgi:hypothetical protein